MKYITPPSLPLTRKLAQLLALAALFLTGLAANAHPYASGVTNDNGTIRFFLNESGGTVYVVFEDNTTNNLGVLNKGPRSFALGAHSSYSIYVHKDGTGTPALISTDSFTNSIWNSPRGVAVNKNPKIGYSFGRIYAGNSAAGGTVGNGFKGIGLYAMNPDQTDAIGKGTNATGTAFYSGSGGAGPWRMRVAPDNTLLVCDFSTPNASLFAYQPDLSNSNLVLSIIGQTAAAGAGIHGDMFGTPTMTGSLATGDLVLWTGDSGMGVPAATATLGPNTHIGDFNCVFRYDIGAGPIPASGWNNPPNYAYTVGLSGIAELRSEVEIGKDGKIIAAFGRANLSNPNIQILDPTGTTPLWDSWHDTSGVSDPWRGENSGANTTGGTYSGVRVSEDGRLLASVDINNGITLAFMTNGIPDDGTLFGIANTPTTANSRGMDWDIADNLYVVSSGQGLLRIYSLGISTTCVTSNDFTGTNGSFQLTLPPLNASGNTIVSQASQNYGTPISGVFRITLSTNTLSSPVVVNFTRGGTAVYTNHYSINTNETPNGVTINPNNVVFPVGTMPGGGNWSVDVRITPTALPVSTNTLTVIMTVTGATNYLAVAPVRGTIFIQNTGPQLLLLSAAASGSTMYRGVTNDFARFVITRVGDTNGPANSFGNVVPKPFTITNINYYGTALFPADYGAQAHRLDPFGDGAISLPPNGPTTITFYPGDTAVTCAVGNPVAHTDLNNPINDVTIVSSLTNQVSGAASTNGLISQDGYLYNVGTALVTNTLLDNRVGPEVVLYSNPLTNALDSVNWTLTFDSTNFGVQQLPLVVPNYVNDTTFGTNDYFVHFGYDPSSDNVGPSIAMANSNWTGVLKMTVNKSAGATEAVNVYPQGQNFQGNYAFRFNMYLSLYDFALNNPGQLALAREFALFGVNHRGTNCIWRPDAAITGPNAPTNSDGVWFAVDASSGSITPADYESYVPGPVPNNANGPTPLPSKVSTPASGVNGIFKHPPFDAANVTSPTVSAPGGGQAIDQWVDVSVEVTKQTNATLYINRSPILVFPLTNGLGLASSYTNGNIMLGYQDPNGNISDNRAFVYYSNVRVVELSPYITAQPALTNSSARSFILLPGTNLAFSASASLGSAPITNMWFVGTGNGTTPNTGVPTALVQSNSVNATSMTDTLLASFNVPTDATNFMAVFSDASGSVTSTVVSVEMVFGPSNKVYNSWATTNMSISPIGALAPTAIQWYFNTVSNLSTATKLANSAHYAGVTTATLTMTNLTSADAGFYWTAVTNVSGYVIPEAATLTVLTPPYQFSNFGLSGTNISLAFTSSNPLDTASAFIVQSAGIVTGPYTNNPAAITGTNPNFSVTIPRIGDQMYYRLKHK